MLKYLENPQETQRKDENVHTYFATHSDLISMSRQRHGRAGGWELS